MTASLYTLGCKVNQYDTNAMAELLAGAGFEILPWGQRSDAYIINTCTVTNVADKKSRNMIRRVRNYADGVVVVCGCLAQSKPEELAQRLEVDAVVGTADRSGIADIVLACIEGGKINKVSDVSAERRYEPLSVSGGGTMTRAYIKVQEGCDSFCSYCIIPYVRGRPRSRDIRDILDEARRVAREGCSEIVITGIHISSYGGEEGLVGLLGSLNKVEGISSIRIGSLEPRIIDDAFAGAVADMEKVCPHFHVSLQSGSASVLKRMNRRYEPRDYMEKISLLRKRFDRPAVTTDIITGFPGETDSEFEETYLFAQEIGFSRLHVFPYSQRAGTPAAKMKQVPLAARKERARRLILLGEQMETEYAACFLNEVHEVLFEQECEGFMEGYTSRYVRVRSSGAKAGERREVLLKNQNGEVIYAELPDKNHGG